MPDRGVGGRVEKGRNKEWLDGQMKDRYSRLIKEKNNAD